jgi:tetratricopeptide (TPR) repeat protein
MLESSTDIKLPIILILVLSFGLYANTLNHEFVLDDKIVITENQFTKKGVAGIPDIFKNDSMTGFFGTQKNLVAGGRYRPLSMAMHAIEFELFGKKPQMYHLLNVLLYALSGVFLFLILLNLFPVNGNYLLGIAFIVTLLFQANPLHTEVVANIKSRDEILSVLLALVSFYFVISYFKKHKSLDLLCAAAIFLAALLSKESAIIFVGIIPLAIWITKKEIAVKKLAVASSVALVLPAAIYLAIRSAVIGVSKPPIAKELMNNPFLDASAGEQLATSFHVMWLYIKLLLFPHPLTHDYYPKQIPISDWGNPLAILGFVLFVGFVVVFIYGVLKRSMWGLFAGIFLAGIVLYSNLLFPIGTFMNERFLYIPSLAFALALGYVLINKVNKKPIILAVVAVMLLGYGFKTVDRNQAWESDITLAVTDVEVSSNSAKCNMSAGGSLIDRAEKERNPTKKRADLVQAVKYLNKSLELYPRYTPPVLLLGNAYTSLGDYKNAILYYDRVLSYQSQVSFALQNLEVVANKAIDATQFELAESAYLTYLKYREDVRIMDKLGELYGKNMQQLPKSIAILEKANGIKPNDAIIMQKLGVAYAMTAQTNKAIDLFTKALEQDKENANLWLNLGYAYYNVGKTDEAQQYLQKAYELNPELKPEG